jgi:hypothetical protein
MKAIVFGGGGIATAEGAALLTIVVPLLAFDLGEQLGQAQPADKQRDRRIYRPAQQEARPRIVRLGSLAYGLESKPGNEEKNVDLDSRTGNLPSGAVSM